MKWIKDFKKFQKIKEAFVATPPPIAHHYNINQNQQVNKYSGEETFHFGKINKNQNLDTDPPQDLSKAFETLKGFSGKKILISFDDDENSLLGKILSSQKINDEDGSSKQKEKTSIDLSGFDSKIISNVTKLEVYNQSDFDTHFTGVSDIKEGTVFLIERGIEGESFDQSRLKVNLSTIFYIDNAGNPQTKKVQPK